MTAKKKNKKRDQDLKKIIPRLANAIRKLATAASGNFGSDCFIHASIAKEILSRLGIESSLKVGHAAWRVGNGDSDIIMHIPTSDMTPQPGGIAYHAWLEVDGHILDLTTYQLESKGAQLDRLDGGKTTVSWCPEYIYSRKGYSSALRCVVQLSAGLYYYREKPELAETVIAAASQPDPDDVELAWLLYQNPEMIVVGPNNMQKEESKNG